VKFFTKTARIWTVRSTDGFSAENIFTPITHPVRFDEGNQTGVSERVIVWAITLVTAVKQSKAHRVSTEANCKESVATTLNRFPWSTQMTTRIPGPSARPTGVAPLLEPQSKDDALLRTWFPNLDEEARDFFSTQWSKTGLPLSGNYETAKKLYDQRFRKGATRSKTSVRPRSLSATMPSGSAREPKSLTERAVHVPSPSAQAPTPAPDPEIYIDLTDFLASTATEAKTEEAPAPLEAKSGMRPEDEALCKELDKSLEDWTQRLKAAKPASRQRETPDFREEVLAHRQKLHQIHKMYLKRAEDQHPLLRERVSAHVSDFLSVVGQSENFHDLTIVAITAKTLAKYYPDAAPPADFGRRLAETFLQLVARPDGSCRKLVSSYNQSLLDAIYVSDDSSAEALSTTAFQYCDVTSWEIIRGKLVDADSPRFSFKKHMKCLENALEQTVRTIRNLSMRGSDQEAVKLFEIAVWHSANFSHTRCLRLANGVLEAYQALSRRAKYLALQDSELKSRLSRALEWSPITEEADSVRKEIKDFAPNLFALPEVSNGGYIVSIIKKLEEAFAQLPEALAGNVAALLHSHIQAFLESASTSSENWDERGARHEALLGSLNYAFAIHGAIASLADLLSAGEVRTVESWFDGDHDSSGRNLKNPIAQALYVRLRALNVRDVDW
jgi:hypothetical protein